MQFTTVSDSLISIYDLQTKLTEAQALMNVAVMATIVALTQAGQNVAAADAAEQAARQKLGQINTMIADHNSLLIADEAGHDSVRIIPRKLAVPICILRPRI